MKGVDVHPKDHSIQIFTDALNEGWGTHLEQVFTEGLWSGRGKRLHINVLRVPPCLPAVLQLSGNGQNLQLRKKEG